MDTSMKNPHAPATGQYVAGRWAFGGVHSRAVYDDRGREICKVSEHWQAYAGTTRVIGGLLASAPALLAERDALRLALGTMLIQCPHALGAQQAREALALAEGGAK